MSYDMLMRRMAAAQPSATGVDRRAFLKLTATSGFALGTFPIAATGEEAAASPKGPPPQPSAFIRVGKDNSITVLVNRRARRLRRRDAHRRGCPHDHARSG